MPVFWRCNPQPKIISVKLQAEELEVVKDTVDSKSAKVFILNLAGQRKQLKFAFVKPENVLQFLGDKRSIPISLN